MTAGIITNLTAAGFLTLLTAYIKEHNPAMIIPLGILVIANLGLAIHELLYGQKKN